MSRMQKTVNLGWKFHRGDCPEAWFKGFDDCQWNDVTLPHDWSVTEPFSQEHSSGSGYLPGGVGWYRARVTLPEKCQGKKVWVVFDGVYNNSMVWVNSYYMGKRPYGYSTFSYDISHAASFGENATQISVRVNHESTADSRWFTGSGITRKVGVIVKEPVYIDSNGVFFTTPEVSFAQASAGVKNSLINETDTDCVAVVRNTLYDDKGRAALTMESACAIPAGQSVEVEQRGTVANPRLWSPEEPYLYTLKTELVRSGEVLDAEENLVGIRTFRFDADEGFFLNGVNMKIKGVCVHHDAGCLGAAAVKKVWERRLRALKGVGCNAIRMSHNPHMPELYDLCDSMGFLVMDEAFDEWEGPKNKWTNGHNIYPPALNGYFEEFPEWHERDLGAMVLRDRNHPSVILWSIGNEIDYPNDPYCHPYFKEMMGNNDANKPDSERKYSPDKPNANRLVTLSRHLVGLVKKWDATRPVLSAVAFPELSSLIGFCDTLDICGYNYKEQLYEEDHTKYPRRIMLGSENITSYSAWTAVRDHKYISGQFLWTGVDFLGEAHGWPVHGSMAGLLTLAGFEKPCYYFRQSLWATKPMVQLATVPNLPDANPWLRHMSEALIWNYPEGGEVTVNCYTNCPTVEIRLNAASLGTYKLIDFMKQGFISCSVRYQEGTLEAIAMAEDGTIVTSVLSTVSAPSALSIVPDCLELKADGEDIAQLELTVVDGWGNWVPNATEMIHVAVEGSGTLLGIENGDQADNTDYSAHYRHAYRGKLLIYVRSKRQPGPIRVVCRSDGSVREAEIVLRAQ